MPYARNARLDIEQLPAGNCSRFHAAQAPEYRCTSLPREALLHGILGAADETAVTSQCTGDSVRLISSRPICPLRQDGNNAESLSDLQCNAAYGLCSGGNLEPARIVCEVDWRECPRAIANYVWTEIVTDVVDFLTGEWMIWRVLVVFFICTILVRVLCCKGKRFDDAEFDKGMLDKVGCKIEDLELKVNILTYKLQYGTWPLPHQIPPSGQKRGLRNVRLTLSSPNDRNNWIKHMLLSPREHNSYVATAQVNSASVRCLTELYDTQNKYGYEDFQRKALPMELGSTKTSKNSSEVSLKRSNTNSVRSENSSLKHSKMSKSENLDVHRQSTKNLSTLPRKRRSKSTNKIPTSKKVTVTNPDPREKFAKTLEDCKWVLMELQRSNKSLGYSYSSSAISDTSSIKDIYSKAQRNTQVPTEKGKAEINEAKNHVLQIHKPPDKDSVSKQDGLKERKFDRPANMFQVVKAAEKDRLPRKLNITLCGDAFPKRSFTQVLMPPMFKSKKLAQTSEETLHRVRKKLESLHDMLETYEAHRTGQSNVERKIANHEKLHGVSRNVVDALVSIRSQIENIGGQRDSSFDVDSSENDRRDSQGPWNNLDLSESDQADRSSLTSVQSSSTSPKARKGVSKRSLQWQRLSGNPAPRAITWPKEIAVKTKTDINQNEASIEPRVKDDVSSTRRIPERAYYSLSTDSFEDIDSADAKKDPYSQSKAPKLPDFYDENGCSKADKGGLEKNLTFADFEEGSTLMSEASSRTEFSKNSESEEKSAALLREALDFKQTLLSRSERENSCSMYRSKIEKNQAIVERVNWYNVENNFQSELLDIITEEQSISSSTEKTSKTHIFLNAQRNEKSQSCEIKEIEDDKFRHESEVQEITSRDYSGLKSKTTSPDYFTSANLISDNNKAVDNKFFERETVSTETPTDFKLRFLGVNREKQCDEKLHLNRDITATAENMEMKSYKNVSTFDDTKVSFVKDKNNETAEGSNENKTQHNFIPDKTIDKIYIKDSVKSENSPNCTVDCVEKNKNNTSLISDTENLQNPNNFIPEVRKTSRGSDNEADNLPEKTSLIIWNQTESSSCESVKQFPIPSDSALATRTQRTAMSSKLEDNESECSSNLNLKRHPGMFSIIEGPSFSANELKKSDSIVRTSLRLEDKGSSMEENLQRETFAPSASNSNPISVVLSKQERQDKRETDINVQQADNVLKDSKRVEDNLEKFSTNTIVIHKSDVTIDVVEKYAAYQDRFFDNISTSQICNYMENAAVNEGPKNANISGHGSGDFSEGQGNVLSSAFRENLNASYTELLSPHSSLYFTDEVSSSTAKFNTANKESSKEKLSSNLNIRQKVGESDAKYVESENKISDVQMINTSRNVRSANITFKSEGANDNSLIDGKRVQNPCDSLVEKNEIVKHNSSGEGTKIRDSCDLLVEKNELVFQSSSIKEDMNSNTSISYADASSNELVSFGTPPSNDDKYPTLEMTRQTEVNTIDQQHSSTFSSLEVRSSITKRSLKGASSLKLRKPPEPHSSQPARTTNSKDGRSTKITGAENSQSKARSNLNLRARRERDSSMESKREVDSERNLSHRRSRSEISSCTNESSPRQAASLPRASRVNLLADERQSSGAESKSKVKVPSKSPLATSRTTSKSCIPILKSRLEAARRSERETRSRSPLRSPLTLTMLWRENSRANGCCANDDFVKAEGPETGEESLLDKDDTKRSSTAGRESTSDDLLDGFPKEGTVIYVNIVTKRDQSTTRIVDPGKFLGYVRDREVKLRSSVDKSGSFQDSFDASTSANEDGLLTSDALNMDSSVISRNDFMRDRAFGPLENTFSLDTASIDELKDACFLAVEQKEVDVTAKPSMADTSTSISDLLCTSKTSRNFLDKFKIRGTPKELNKEEYIALLETLNQESNSVHLQDLQNLCEKLVSGF
ncbi:hypothetical protein KM043_007769 [Ampulex compressa]|nr:hypothetical protein KM043_007769 [Ampulex compressa]